MKLELCCSHSKLGLLARHPRGNVRTISQAFSLVDRRPSKGRGVHVDMAASLVFVCEPSQG